MSMKSYTEASATPQTKPMPGRKEQMVKNAAGGYTFAIDPFTRLDRFLIMGSEGGTYYATQRKITIENAKGVEDCLKIDGLRTVKAILDISLSGRAPKQEPCLYALAIAIKKGDVATRRAAAAAVPQVARTASALFDFASAVKSMGGFSRVQREAIAGWYWGKKVDDLAYQVVKYRERNGWSHRDLLHMARVTPGPNQKAIFDWIFAKESDGVPSMIQTFERAQEADTAAEVMTYIYKENLPREAVPDRFLRDPGVWEALLQRMPMGAMIRNLGRMTNLGLLATGSEWADMVSARVTSSEGLEKARIHPMSILIALLTYQQGHGDKGSLDWKPNAQILTALDEGFYKAFTYLPSTGKRIRVGVDISGSMTHARCNGVPMLTAAQASGVIAMTIIRSEPKASVVGYDTRAIEIEIDREMRLDRVVRELAKQGGGTDCAIPLRQARQEGKDYDAVVIVTDNESWNGPSHAVEELNAYRQKVGHDVNLISAAMTATRNTVGDVYDPSCLDVCGIDADILSIVSDFIGR